MPADLRLFAGFVLGISFCLASRGLLLVVQSRARRVEGFTELFYSQGYGGVMADSPPASSQASGPLPHLTCA